MQSYIAMFALLLAALATPAHAAMISTNSHFGPDSITIDTNTHLAWLDLSQTFGQSMDSIKTQMAAGDKYYGYRYATADEVRTLYVDAGLYAYPYGSNKLFWAEYKLMGLIGYAPDFSFETESYGARYVWGITGSLTPPGASAPHGEYIGSALYAEADFPVPSGFVRTYVHISYNCDDTTFRSTDTWSAQGSFLVRNHASSPAPVPEPSTFLLLGAGLAGIPFVMRRVKV